MPLASITGSGEALDDSKDTKWFRYPAGRLPNVNSTSPRTNNLLEQKAVKKKVTGLPYQLGKFSAIRNSAFSLATSAKVLELSCQRAS